jgi:hypothetical protein
MILKKVYLYVQKVYGGKFTKPIILPTGEKTKEIVKVKGFKNLVSCDELKTILKKDASLDLNPEK